MTIFLLSLAGFPLTGGFIGKFSSVTFSNTLNGQTIPIYEGVNPGNSNAGANSA